MRVCCFVVIPCMSSLVIRCGSIRSSSRGNWLPHRVSLVYSHILHLCHSEHREHFSKNHCHSTKIRSHFRFLFFSNSHTVFYVFETRTFWLISIVNWAIRRRMFMGFLCITSSNLTDDKCTAVFYIDDACKYMLKCRIYTHIYIYIAAIFTFWQKWVR